MNIIYTLMAAALLCLLYAWGTHGQTQPPQWQPPAEQRCHWVGHNWTCSDSSGRRWECRRIGSTWDCKER